METVARMPFPCLLIILLLVAISVTTAKGDEVLYFGGQWKNGKESLTIISPTNNDTHMLIANGPCAVVPAGFHITKEVAYINFEWLKEDDRKEFMKEVNDRKILSKELVHDGLQLLVFDLVNGTCSLYVGDGILVRGEVIKPTEAAKMYNKECKTQ